MNFLVLLLKAAIDKLMLEYGGRSNQNNGNILSQTITVPAETRNSTTYTVSPPLAATLTIL